MEKMSEKTNALNWFEIPALDTARASKFYETIFDINMEFVNMMGMELSMFPIGEGKASGALVKSENHKPSKEGSLIYLNANPNLQTVLDKIEGAGGMIAMGKTFIDEQTGYIAFFIDTEGNYVGLHSRS